MRTTLILDDQLVREAKKHAADAGVTLSEVVNRALRAALGAPEVEAPAFDMITYGERQPPVRHEPQDFARVLEEDDAAGVGS